jgi:hypothetical protein
MSARRSPVLLLAALLFVACSSSQGRNIGTAVGVATAVFGGPQSEPIDDAIERYRVAREAGEMIGSLTEVTRFVTELQQLEGVGVSFTEEGQIDLFLADPHRNLPALASLLAKSPYPEEQFIAIEGSGVYAFEIREALIRHGLTAEAIEAHRTDELDGAAVHIRYRS